MDLDNTLFDFEAIETVALEATANQFQVEDVDAFKKQYIQINSALWKRLELGELSSHEVKYLRFKHLVETMNVPLDHELMSGFYLEELSKGIALFPHAESVCAYLSERYRLVALTNGVKSVQMSRLKKSGFDRYFEAIIISEDVGYSKPEMGIFQVALDRIGHDDKSTVLMVGDSLAADMKGANAFGIDTLWVNFAGKSASEDVTIHWEIRELNQIFDIL